jgi:hypothetical protein
MTAQKSVAAQISRALSRNRDFGTGLAEGKAGGALDSPDFFIVSTHGVRIAFLEFTAR